MNNNSKEQHIRDDLLARGICDSRVITAFRDVPRELFVREEDISRAYNDTPLPIGYGQTISQPYIVACMSELLALNDSDTVLEIGTGSGYQTAILSRLCSRVYSVESIPELHNSAQQALSMLKCENVRLRLGDGYLGWPEFAPYQGIIVTCAPESIPEALLEQLDDGGRLLIPVGAVRGRQELILVRNQGGKILCKSVLPVAFVPMVHQKQQPG